MGVEEETIASLHSAIIELNREIEDKKNKVFQTVDARHIEFVRTFDQVSELRGEVSALSSSLQKIADMIIKPPNGVKPVLESTAAEYKKVTTELESLKSVIDILKILSEVHSAFTLFDKKVEAGEYCHAAYAIKDMEQHIEYLPKDNAHGANTNVVKTVRKDFRLKKAQLRSRLEEMFARALQFKPNELTVTREFNGVYGQTPHHDNPSSLADILEALRILDLLEDKFKEFSHSLLVDIIQPIIQEPRSVVTVQPVRHNEFCIRIGLDSTAEASSVSTPGALFSKLTELFTCLAERIMDKNHDALALLSASLWSKVAEMVIESCLSRTIPEQTSQLKSYQHIVSETEEFELKLFSLGAVPETQRVLSAYVRDYESHFAHRRRASVLEGARALLLSEDHNTVVVTDGTERGSLSNLTGGKNGKKKGSGIDAEGFFRLPTCQVTVSTQKLVEMAHQTLQEVGSGVTPTGALLLYRLSRDIFDLFRALKPSVHASHIENVPHFCMLFHNDCMYIAHHLMTLGHQYRARFPPPLNKTATFVDMVPMFRDLGEQAFLKMMRKQRQQLLEFVGGAGDFTDMSDDGRFKKAEQSVNQVLHHLNQLANVWKSVLPRDVFLQAMGQLVDVPLKFMCDSIQRIPDISVHDAPALKNLIESMVMRMSNIFDVPLLVPEDVPADSLKVAIPKYVPVWEKVQLLAEILDADLQGILNMHSQGRLNGRFNYQELRGLVLALFADTPHRALSLKRLES
eukprot:GILJ01010826.1.p1 GENE.GILJ01010826.1~~GILJ01010826.1.p1  ORF type:complete len:743 (-),score=142.94 GILJ01010826.1:136-2364(-)